jgi:hypothetical protein
MALRDPLLISPDVTSKHIAEILGKFNVPVCLVPDNVLRVLMEHTTLQFINPSCVREYFRVKREGCVSVQVCFSCSCSNHEIIII